MNFDLSESETAFRDEVRGFLETRVPREIRDRLRLGHAPRKQDTVTVQRILNERGWAAPHWPREYGGAELGQMERLILLNELYRLPAPMPSVFNVTMLGPILLKFGTEQQRRFFMPKLVNMDLWFCQGFSEPGSGSDLASLRTSATREDDHYVVNGQKIWTTSAHLADWIFCLVRTDRSGRKQDGISFLLIDLKTPGVTVRPIITIDGAHHLNEVFFDNVRVPAGNLVGRENHGWECAKFLLGNERTSIASVGFFQERLAYARALASTLTMAGQHVINNGDIRAELALLDADLRALEISNWRFLLGPELPGLGSGFASVLKLQATDIHQRLLALLARIAGPVSLERFPSEGEGAQHWASAIQSRALHSRAASIYGGSSEIQKDILARLILR